MGSVKTEHEHRRRSSAPSGLLAAELAHIDWLGRIVRAAADGRVDSALMNETANCDCVFGRWLAETSDLAPADRELLDVLHRRMHRGATRMLEVIAAGSEPDTAFDEWSREVIAFNEGLRALRQASGGTGRGLRSPSMAT